MNLIEMFSGTIGKELSSHASRLLGESPAATQTAVANAVPALLGGLLKQGASPGGAADVFRMVTDRRIDTGMLDDLGSLLGGGERTQGLQSMGAELLGGLFGNRTSGLESALASIAGIKPGSATKLAGMAAPLVLGFLKKQVGQQNLDAGGLARLLMGQKDHLRTGLDSRVTDALGFGDVTSFLSGLGGQAEQAVRSGAAQASAATKSAGNRFLPWILVAAAILVGLWLLRSCSEPAERAVNDAARTVQDTASQATQAVKDTADDAARAVGDAATGAAAAIDRALRSVTLPGGMSIDVPAGGFLDSLVQYLNGSAVGDSFTFDALQFETGSATLTGVSDRQIGTLAAVLGAYPNVRISVDGHTDDAGDAATNLALSQARAGSVKQALIDKGVAADRITVQGYGDTKPIASNDTESGRAANRRVELVVTDR